MVDQITLTIINSLIDAIFPSLQHTLSDTMRNVFRLDEREERNHLKRVLENAVKRGRAELHTQRERDQFNDILTVLLEPGSHRDTLCHEVMQLFTLSSKLDYTKLNEVYNHSLRFRNLSEPTRPIEVDAVPYLDIFFKALKEELYADSYFKQPLSEALKISSTQKIEQSLQFTQQSTSDAADTLHQIKQLIANEYKDQFKQDQSTYLDHIERTFRRLEIAGIVASAKVDELVDPELKDIFIPLKISLESRNRDFTSHKQEFSQDAMQIKDQTWNAELITTVLESLEQDSYLVLLGGPGSGKSTIVRYLTWSHAIAHQQDVLPFDLPLLPGKPVPLRIELRRFNEALKQHLEYDFLDYATKIMLGSEGIKINRLMFEMLLKQKDMLLLFDGLDEVGTTPGTTRNERMDMVRKIESLAQTYPGNRILVTSRKVGYELAGCSKQLFSHAQVQELGDEEIKGFLERWYEHVLRLKPIPQAYQQKKNALLMALQENPYLHELAETPLLLTVIAALHQYEQLPDRRVELYDRCADLLLARWAERKGTNVRWAGMIMRKDEQYACIARLGFKMHERLQQASGNAFQVEEGISYISTKVMLKEIEEFLRDHNVIKELTKQRIEADLFLQLIKEEVGLIALQGTSENEDVYDFVHTTFREYFAAADVYERYINEENPSSTTIISRFLEDHLHDPHWHEVILLLLGKLKRKPVTTYLRKLLKGEIKSRRSHYTDIMQQDLFFVCDCLAEEMPVEPDLAEMVIVRLYKTIKNSSSSQLQERALRYLGMLVTRWHTRPERRELMDFVSKAVDRNTIVQSVRILYQQSSFSSISDQRLALQALLTFAQDPNLSIDLAIEAIKTILQDFASDNRLQAMQALLKLTQRPGIDNVRIIQVYTVLYQNSLNPVEDPSEEPEERKLAAKELLNLAHTPNLPIKQVLQIADVLYKGSYANTEEDQASFHMLLDLVERSDLSIAEAAMRVLYEAFPPPGEEEKRLRAFQKFCQRVQEQAISPEQQIQIAAIPVTVHGEFYQQGGFYPDAASSLKLLLTLPQQEEVKVYLESHWNFGNYTSVSLSDVPYAIELMQQELLPPLARDYIYQYLVTMIPQFNEFSASPT